MKFLLQKRRTPAQALKLTLLNAVVVITIEMALMHWMAARDTVSVLLAAGGAHYFQVALALGFVLLRIFVFLILPGLVARDLFLTVVRTRGGAVSHDSG